MCKSKRGYDFNEVVWPENSRQRILFRKGRALRLEIEYHSTKRPFASIFALFARPWKGYIFSGKAIILFYVIMDKKYFVLKKDTQHILFLKTSCLLLHCLLSPIV